MTHDRQNRQILSADFIGDKFSSRTWFYFAEKIIVRLSSA